MTIRYLYHSGFAIECDTCTLVIDYYRDTCEGKRCAENGVVAGDLLARPGRFYVLSSHGHGDHFNPVVMSWQTQRSDIVYLLSSDIRDANLCAPADNVHFLSPGDTYEDQCLHVQAFGSTDLGISFVLELEGKTLLHAGDLNNWHWTGQWSEQEEQQAETDYLRELQTLQSAVKYLDAAMFPIDPRLGEDCGRGAEQLWRAISVGRLLPMHFAEHYDAPAHFAKTHPDIPTTVWTRRGESIPL